MIPHVPTLTLATVGVSAILNLLLFCTWLQARQERALLYWGPAGLAGAAGLMLLVSDPAVLPAETHVLANALLIVWAGLTWCGARSFAGRRPHAEWVGLVAAAWIALNQFEFIASDLAARVSVLSVSRAVFVALTIFELWRGRRECLFSRWAAIGALGIHGAALLARIPIVWLVSLPPEPEIFRSGWFGATAMGQLLYTTAIAFVLLAMAKERAELRHRLAARTDFLTRLLNRGAFMHEGALCLEQNRRPVAALVFDLDNFKAINDRHGHAAGDRVLQRFAATLRAEMYQVDVVGRLGGEEFACLLPGCDLRVALAEAERVRRAFAASAVSDEAHIGTTVSVGVAVARRSENLATLLAEADRAVYLAKRAGRNCVRSAVAPAAENHVAPSRPSFAAA